MGVTIHFEGRLRSDDDLDQVLSMGRKFAQQSQLEVQELDAEKKRLIRVHDAKQRDYEGEVRGIQFHPHANSDPLVLEFDKDLYIQQYCKTQFAGIATHIEIIQFLRNIEPHFEFLRVYDEGDFWATGSIERLEQKFEDFFAAFEMARKENPKLKGPFCIEGRIIDLMGQAP